MNTAAASVRLARYALELDANLSVTLSRELREDAMAVIAASSIIEISDIRVKAQPGHGHAALWRGAQVSTYTVYPGGDQFWDIEKAVSLADELAAGLPPSQASYVYLNSIKQYTAHGFAADIPPVLVSGIPVVDWRRNEDTGDTWVLCRVGGDHPFVTWGLDDRGNTFSGHYFEHLLEAVRDLAFGR